MKTHIYMWFLIWFLQVEKYSTMCPSLNCICEETYLVCKDDDPIPGQIYQPTAIPRPALDLNHVSQLLGGVLPENITDLQLANSPITAISDDALDQSIFTLKSIAFTNTLLTSIPSAFQRLKALKYLSIINTPIQNWNEAAMLNVAPILDTLSLTNVSLTAWPSWLSQCVNLTELTFSLGFTPNLPDDAFDSRWVNLNVLALSGLHLRTLPKSLSLFTTLTALDLGNNKISNLTFLPTRSPLNLISLNGNNITDSAHVTDSINVYAKNLTNLNLEDNLMTTIPNLSFLTALQYVDMSRNRFFDPLTGSLPASLDYCEMSSNYFQRIPPVLASLRNLYQFQLASNSITQIWGSDFTPYVGYVDLQSNKITSLTASSLPEVSVIYNLYLDNNPLVNIEQMTFKNQVKLNTLSLRNTPLSRLPLALGDLKSLTFLDVSGSPYLKCTCQEKSLSSWVGSVPNYTFSGDCGLIGILDFFTTFAPQCP